MRRPAPDDEPTALLARVSRWDAVLAIAVAAVGGLAALFGRATGLSVLAGAVIGGLLTASGPYLYLLRSRRGERGAGAAESSSPRAESAGSALAAYAVRLAALAALLWGASRLPGLDMRTVALTVLGLVVASLVVDAAVVLRARQF